MVDDGKNCVSAFKPIDASVKALTVESSQLEEAQNKIRGLEVEIQETNRRLNVAEELSEAGDIRYYREKLNADKNALAADINVLAVEINFRTEFLRSENLGKSF